MNNQEAQLPHAGSKKRTNGRRNWILFFVSAFFVFINFFVSLTILPEYVLHIGGTLFQSGLHNTLFFVTAVLLRFYFGPYADRKSRKIPLLIGAFVFATAPGLFLLSTHVTALLVARIYQAVGLATFLASGSSLVADLAPKGKTGTYLGVYRMLMTMSLLIGPTVALHVIERNGFGHWFMISMAVGILSVLLMWLVKVPKTEHVPGQASPVQWSVLLKNREIWLVLFFSLLSASSYGAILTYAVTYVSQNTAVANPGIFFVFFGLGGILANLTMGHLSDIYGRKSVVMPIVMGLGLANMTLYFISHSVLVLVAGSLLTGAGIAGSLLVLVAWLIDLTVVNTRATLLSMQESTFDIASALGPFIMGLTASWLGLAPSFVIIGILVFVPGLVAFVRGIYNR